MAYDIECLEIMPESVVFSDRDGEQQPVVIPSVKCSRDRVDVHFFSQVEHFSGERYLVNIDLGTQAAVAGEPFDSIGKPSCHEISI